MRSISSANTLAEVYSSPGSVRARLDGTSEWKRYDAGSEFQVPGDAGFDIAVESGIAEYICSFEP